MKFNNYLWNIYKQSDDYKAFCNAFDKYNSIDKFSNSFETYESDENKDEYDEFIKSILNIYESLNYKNFDVNNARESFTSWIESGIKINGAEDYLFTESSPLQWCDYISDWQLSPILYIINPSYFFIYRFNRDCIDLNFQTFIDICSLFEISLPQIPAKRDKLARALYYIDICDAMLEFRNRHFLTSFELHALIYDYGYKILFDGKSAKQMLSYQFDNVEHREDLPAPTKAWFIVDRFYYNHEYLTNLIKNYKYPIVFEVSENAKEGDIFFLYSPKPYYAIHSIWKLNKKSFVDPFFYDYKNGYICKPLQIPKINLKELKANKILTKKFSCKFKF